jgi:hypothetical protein
VHPHGALVTQHITVGAVPTALGVAVQGEPVKGTPVSA